MRCKLALSVRAMSTWSAARHPEAGEGGERGRGDRGEEGEDMTEWGREHGMGLDNWLEASNQSSRGNSTKEVEAFF